MTAMFRAANVLLAISVAAAIGLEIALLATDRIDALFESPTSLVPFGTRLVEMFSFLTTLSNVLAGVIAVLLAIQPERSGRVWAVVRLDALISISAIGLAFQVLFAPHLDLTGAPLLMTVLYHMVNPLLAVLTWLVLDTRRQWKFRDVLWALVWPIVYLVFVFVRGAFAHWYPYTLADVDALGVGVAYRNGIGVVGSKTRTARHTSELARTKFRSASYALKGAAPTFGPTRIASGTTICCRSIRSDQPNRTTRALALARLNRIDRPGSVGSSTHASAAPLSASSSPNSAMTLPTNPCTSIAAADGRDRPSA